MKYLGEAVVTVALATITGVVTWIKTQQYQKRREEYYANRTNDQHLRMQEVQEHPVRISRGGYYPAERERDV
jgi:hypothetical protein